MTRENNTKTFNVYIDALPICSKRMSGIGHLTLGMIKGLSEIKELKVVLVLPLFKKKIVEALNIPNTQIKVIPLPARMVSLLTKARLMPPVDVFVGKGAYIFPNYRNWPLLFSKSLTYFHDISFILYPETLLPKNLKYLTRNYKSWIKRTDKIVTLSPSSKEDIIKHLGVPESLIEIVPPGVDTGMFYKRSQTEAHEVTKKYGIPSLNNILYIGNLEPRKNLLRLIKAFLQLPEDLRNKHNLIIIGGGGWLNEQLLALIDSEMKKGEVYRVNDYVEDSDLPAIYSSASALVLPSIYEGFGISPLQAMACRVPVAVSDSSSLPFVVGEAGVYFDPNNEKDISNKIYKILTDKDKNSELSQKGLRQAKKFSWQNSANRLYDCILEVLNTG